LWVSRYMFLFVQDTGKCSCLYASRSSGYMFVPSLGLPRKMLVQPHVGSFIVPCSWRCLCMSKELKRRCGWWPVWLSVLCL